MLLAFNFLKKYRLHVSIATLSVYFVVFGGLADLSYLLGANSLGLAGHEKFNGTVYPYEAAADWSSLSDSERDIDYSDLSPNKKIPPIEYDEKELSTSFADLSFGTLEGNKLRNAKVIYSVPYLGTYKLDGKAGTGSHGAVDIKLHMNTPIFSIANGVVTKVKDIDYGFGKHIVVRHNNVPDVENPGKLTTYYSSYSHLNGFKVSVGDVVKKGQLIGFSGSTGTSTTPHLHFQIDTADSPFQPYWPFTNADLNEAGMSFFEGVNAGLKQENARKYTVNPMDFVQASLEYQVDEPKVEEEKEELKPSEETKDIVVGDTASVVEFEKEENEGEAEEIVLSSNVLNLDFKTPEFVILGEESEISFVSNSRLETSSGTGVGLLEVKSDTRANVQYPTEISKGENKIVFEGKELGDTNLTVRVDNELYELPKFEVRPFMDISAFDKDVRQLTSLKKAKIIEGVEGRFMPEQEVNRAAALKFLIETLSVASPLDIGSLDYSDVELSFDDVSGDDWFDEYIKKAIKLNSVTSEPESFNPNRTVILPELLKMYFEAMKADLPNEAHSSLATYFDTQEWYAPYMQEALNRNIITTDDMDVLDKPLTRREVAVISYKFLSLIETGRYAY